MKWYEVVPVEQSFFQVAEKPTRLRLSVEQVALNFGSRSPWPAGQLLFRQDAAALYLWFVKQPAVSGGKVQIPEGYLLAKPFLDRTAAILVRKKKTAWVYTVIKKGQLRAQVVFSAAMNSEEDVEQKIGLLEREFSLVQPEVIHLEDAAPPTPSWRDLWDFLILKADQNLLPRMQGWLKNGAIAILAVSAFYSVFNQNFLEHQIESKTQQLKQLQQQNSTYRQRLLKISGESEFWGGFLVDESGQATWLEVLDALAESFQAQNGYLKSVRFVGRELTVQAGLGGTAPELVKNLLETGLFSESKIISTEEDPDNPGTDLVSIRLVLQTASEVTDG